MKIANGKVYINGRPAPEGSVQTGDRCPALPPLPPKGGKGGKGAAGGVIVRNDMSGPVTEGAGEPGPSASAVLG
ncbi:hypothetical protein [Streptomyces sp. IBSBF 2435]|uniref:hypothetical protein n=1 Tax=Streptomyces sp. IBSBF 2435 TaxID=2903531 RepID=UPI002FDC305E